jgi:GntR family transcriptional regulator/MocR family aminotransferase
VQSTAGHFMDKPDNVVSMINLATVRSLEAKWDRVIDPLRFRANFYIDGLRPWEEFDWIGSDILLGDALLRVDRRNGRCGATNVNPANGQRDMDIPLSLRHDFGHKDLGIYLIVRKAGKVVVGDSVTVPLFESAEADALRTPSGTMSTTASAAGTPAAPTSRRHICRGCYFIYDESIGFPSTSIPPGTPFSDIAPGWRCPDCGTDKSTFRPHVTQPFGTTGR